MFKCRHTGCDDSVLALRLEMRAKKSSVKIGEIAKYIEKYLDKLDKHDALMNAGKELASFNGIELNIYCNIRRKKNDGPLPSRVAELRVFANHLAGRDTIELKDYIMDQGAFAEDSWLIPCCGIMKIQ